MKKTLFSIVFSLLFCFFAATFSFSSEIPNEFLFIEGSAERNDQLDFFITNFNIEAVAAGYTITESKNDAAFTFRFAVSPNTIIDDEGKKQPALQDDNQFVIRISLVYNNTDDEVLYFDFFFTELDEMYEYTQSIFNKATIYIPPSDKEIIVEIKVPGEIDRGWQNKWLYLKLSVDYPISFFALQPTGLKGNGQAAYGEIYDPITGMISYVFMPLDHIINPRPGLTAGIEIQILNFISFAFNFHATLGDTATYSFFNMAASAELRFNIKTKNFLLQPYGAFMYPLNKSGVFKEVPLFAAGGGIEAGVRGGKNGSFFLNVNFLYYFGDVLMHNKYGPLYPLPKEIHYKRFTLGLGIGYKLGFANRKPRRQNDIPASLPDVSEEESIEPVPKEN